MWRILRFLQRRGAVTLVTPPGDGEVTVVTDEATGETDPLLANDRLSILDDGNVRLDFKKPWSDRTSSVDLPPLAPIARLAALVPPPPGRIAADGRIDGGRTLPSWRWATNQSSKPGSPRAFTIDGLCPSPS